MLRLSIISLLILCISTTLNAKEVAVASSTDLWERPVIIGASVSDGYHHQERLGGPKSDALAMDHFIKKHFKNNIEITNLSHRFCFFSPLIISHKQLFDAQKIAPSVVIAVDQLFWHIYGIFPSEEDRLKAFQNALDKLTTIECPLVIGNIPDASKAVRKMLSPRQVPSLETIDKANATLITWVNNRVLNKKQTVIVDLATFMKLSVADKEIKLNNITYPAGTTKAFLQSDMLHPTAIGVTAISHAVMDATKALKIVTP